MNNLNEALFKDLVQSTDFKKNKSVRNPLNIIWMLENTNIVSKQAKEYLDKLKIKQSTFTEKNTRKASSVICKILNNEIVFIKRFDFLLSKIESIQPFAMPIVDLKSISILNHSIDCGLNINVEMNDTYLLKYAIESKNSVISNHLYDLPTIDKLKIDNQGNNLAHLLATQKNYTLIDKLSKEHIDLFYVKNKDNKTAIEIMFNYRQYKTLQNKAKLLLKNSILNFLNLHNTDNKIVSEETIEIIKKSDALKDIFIESNYIKLTHKLGNKNIVTIKNKVNKIRNIIH